MKIVIPNKKIRNILRAYTGVLSILYILFGSMEVLVGFGCCPSILRNSLFFGKIGMGGLPSGITLCVIGAVLLHGSRKFKLSERVRGFKNISFQFVGLLLSIFFCGLSLLIMGSHWLSSLLSGEKYLWQADFGPGIWLLSLAIPGFIFFLRGGAENDSPIEEAP